MAILRLMSRASPKRKREPLFRIGADFRIHDELRIKFFEGYLTNLRDAVVEDGVDLRSYFAWSFMDNFEWNSGLIPRFGSVYVDYETFERTPKDSAYWLGKVSATKAKLIKVL
jgi:beta-glucosidase/6-phospho-beta-glucosidase/beta-galactosidase